MQVSQTGSSRRVCIVKKKKRKIAARSCSFALYLERVLCACVCLFSELKELNSSLTTDEMMSEIEELKTECAGHRARLEKIKSATNHVTPAEKEKVGVSLE